MLERRLESYEGLHRRLRKNKVEDAASTELPGDSNQQLIEFFLSEMEKQQAVIAKMAAAQQVLETKLQESMHKTHKFHRQQLDRMSMFHEVMHMIEKEFVRSSLLRDEEKVLAQNQQDKKASAIKRALGEQIADVKTEATQQRRRMEIKFEKRLVDLATENQLLKAENLELRDELHKVATTTRSNKRTLRVLSDELLKIKRAGLAPLARDAGDDDLMKALETRSRSSERREVRI
ncbi:hypothetical protein PINS_up004912 [Pythium insidiosum]|nr:hypothetical protein PINS_up004912 [Pythium insidiosum]